VLSQISICALVESSATLQNCERVLNDPRFKIHSSQATAECLDHLQSHRDGVDCLILQGEVLIAELTHQLCKNSIVLPAIVIQENAGPVTETPSLQYHSAEVHISSSSIEKLSEKVDLAIAQFVRLAPLQCVIPVVAPTQLRQENTAKMTAHADPILAQQQRLTERLKERLGYLGVYYKRDPKQFLRHLPSQEARHLIQLLDATYREIVLNYFSKTGSPNASIERFVDMAFFVDIPVTRIVKIHMDLMDDFSKQLKLEGRSEEILLDYRLTLIDVIAHLSEMYRRSIPRDS
jgi:circadian clock protein KaiA